MQPNAISNRYLVGSIISGIFMFISGIVGVILFVVGKIFTANPEDVKVEINGRLLEGKEAAEKALEIGKFFPESVVCCWSQLSFCWRYS